MLKLDLSAFSEFNPWSKPETKLEMPSRTGGQVHRGELKGRLGGHPSGRLSGYLVGVLATMMM